MTMTLSEYVENLKGKRIGVIGLGISNMPLIRLLSFAGCNVTACDARTVEKLGMEALSLTGMGVRLRLGPDYLENLDFDVIFRTPGLMPFEPHLQAAADRGAVITSEMEAFFQVCPCKIIAVTGSDGKTTTTTIISELLKAAGRTVHLGGNIGHPLLCDAPMMKKEDVAVVELSSFQLHSMHCRPNVSVITNISPNHLDKHKDYDDYITAKKSIFLSQTSEDALILNADDALVSAFENEAKGEVRYFGMMNDMPEACSGTAVTEGPCHACTDAETNSKATAAVNDGVYCVGIRGSAFRRIIRVENGETSLIMPSDDIYLPGEHNIKNFIAAFAATAGLVDNKTCAAVAGSFKGVEHRLETVRKFKGVTYINDSIGSSPTRTIAGLKALKKKPIVILGGYDKLIPFDELGTEVCLRAKAAVLTGATAEKIDTAIRGSAEYEKAVENGFKIILEPDFDLAVSVAAEAAEEGDIVLLSPACASFDRFKNFEERGNHFKALVSAME